MMEDTDEIRNHVLELIKRKDVIENEIKQLNAILDQDGVGMKMPLIDGEGFPINNINIYQVRHARQKIICLQNDHKQVMKKIESGLHRYYGNSSQKESLNENGVQMAQNTNVVNYQIPFAKVTFVDEGSPAEDSGINGGDLIVEFGSVNHSNFQTMNDIVSVVQHSEDQQLNVKLKRREKYIITRLTPKKWMGKGLIDKKDVSTKRKIFAKLLEKERSRTGLLLTDTLYDFKNECTIVDQTLESIRNLICDFEGPQSDYLFKRIHSRLIYLDNRIKRIKVEVENKVVETFKKESVASVLELEVLLSDKVFKNMKPPDGDLNLPQSSFSNQQPTTIQHCVNIFNKSVPVYKWGLKFSGKDGSTLLLFLERTKEYCLAKGISET
ncbi:hypothetical protein FQA39_LY18136 [Lamprigera yunnana]|nr:hypothetical protein FQA39_LY18136 [Lamprigera yunnana]